VGTAGTVVATTLAPETTQAALQKENDLIMRVELEAQLSNPPPAMKRLVRS
jgi:hypothetical protein